MVKVKLSGSSNADNQAATLNKLLSTHNTNMEQLLFVLNNLNSENIRSLDGSKLAGDINLKDVSITGNFNNGGSISITLDGFNLDRGNIRLGSFYDLYDMNRDRTLGDDLVEIYQRLQALEQPKPATS